MFKAGQKPQPVHSVIERSSIWLYSPKADLPFTEWTVFDCILDVRRGGH